MTTGDLINSAARLIGVLASGESLASSESNDALTALNQMVDTWSNENLLIYAKTQETFTFTAGKQTYTMGTGGDLNTTRSMKIENSIVQIPNGATTFDLQMDIINQDQWASISTKSTQSTIPLWLYQQGTYPLDTLYVWPVPQSAYNWVLWSWKPLSTFASLTATVDLPQGYAKALRYNLAVELAPEYGRALDPVVVEQAAESKATLKRMNHKQYLLGTDPAAMPHSPVFNWLTGESK